MVKTHYQLAANGSLTEDHLKDFLKSSSINEKSPKNITLLVEAARKGHSNVVRLLLNHDADVNQRGIRNRTCLHYVVTASGDREKTLQEIFCKNPDMDAADDDGNTALILAVQQKSNLRVVRLLLANQASPTVTNNKGESAKDIAAKTKDHHLKTILLRTEEEFDEDIDRGVTFVEKVTNFGIYILAYVGRSVLGGGRGVITKPFGIAADARPFQQIDDSQAKPNSELELHRRFSEDMDNAKTVDSFKKNLDTFLEESPELTAFFKPGNDFFRRVAEKALELRHDENNHLKTQDQIRDLTRIALYQPILYCDDSGSMKLTDKGSAVNRHELLRRLVTRISGIATRIVPDGHGTHLRFINKDLPDPEKFNHLKKDAIKAALDFRPDGGSPIGTQLRNKIIKPLVFDVIERGDRLERPILIIVITDGVPGDENLDTFKNAIMECTRELVRNSYEPEAVRFLVSRVGVDAEAADFIKNLANDPDMERVIHCTQDSLDTTLLKLEENERHVEEWLLNILMSPIIGKLRDNLGMA